MVLQDHSIAVDVDIAIKNKPHGEMTSSCRMTKGTGMFCSVLAYFEHPLKSHTGHHKISIQCALQQSTTRINIGNVCLLVLTHA